MRKFFLFCKKAITLFGATIILILLIFFYNDPDIKLKKITTLAKQSIGFGADYSAFTAQSFDDYLQILKRGIAYYVGINREEYPIINLSLNMNAVSSLNRQRKILLTRDFG